MSLVNYFLPDLIEVRGFTHAVNVGADRLRFEQIPDALAVAALAEEQGARWLNRPAYGVSCSISPSASTV